MRGMRKVTVLLLTALFPTLLHAAGDADRVRKDVIYKTSPQGALGLDLHYPSAPAPDAGHPFAVFFHGGGWAKGNKTIGSEGVRFLAVDALNQAGFCVASVNYRLCSKDAGITIRDCVTDCFDAVRYLAKNADSLSLDAGQVFTMGDSAGGHLAQMLLLAPPASFPGDPGLADARFHLVAGVSWYGPCDFEKSDLFRKPDGTGGAERFMDRLLRGSESPEAKLATIRELSPVTYLRADMPPLLMLQGDQDPTIPVHHARYMKLRADQAGAPVTCIIVENASHGWNSSGGPIRPSLDEIVAKTAAFMKQHLEQNQNGQANPPMKK